MADEVMTFDEILADPLYKSEFDRRVTKALQTVQGKLDAAEDKLKTAQDALKSFEGVDVAQLKEQVEKLKSDLASKDTEWKEKLSEMQFYGTLEKEIIGSKAKNAKAVMALLDVDALKASKNQEADIKTALEALKKDSDYLFESDQTPPPYAAGTGTTPPSGGKYPPEVAAIRAAAGLKNE